MNITDIRIRKTYSDNRLRALVSITVDYDLAVHDIKSSRDRNACLLQCPAAKMKTAPSGISPIPSPLRQESSWKMPYCRLTSNTSPSSRKWATILFPTLFLILLPLQNSLPVRLLCGSKIFTIIQTLPFMHKKSSHRGALFIFSPYIPISSGQLFPQAGSPKHLPMVSQSTLAALLQRP